MQRVLDAKELAKLDPRLLSLHLVIYNSRQDKFGNCYWAFQITAAGTRWSVQATSSGSGNNIRQAELYLRGRWPETGEPRWYITEQELPIRKFDRMVKKWPHAGCGGDEILEYIKNQIAKQEADNGSSNADKEVVAAGA